MRYEKKEDNPMEILRMQRTMSGFQIRKSYNHYRVCNVYQTRERRGERNFWRNNSKKKVNCSNQRTRSKDSVFSLSIKWAKRSCTHCHLENWPKRMMLKNFANRNLKYEQQNQIDIYGMRGKEIMANAHLSRLK